MQTPSRSVPFRLLLLSTALAIFIVPCGSVAADAASPTPAVPAQRPGIAAPAAAALSSVRPALEAETDRVFGVARLHQVSLSLTRTEWDVLVNETVVARNSSAGGGPAGEESDIVRADGRTIHIGGGFGGLFPWVHADVRLGGLALQDVGLRFKGNSSYNASLGSLHRNMKLKTDFHGGTGSWEGHSSLNFNAGVMDPSRIRESLSYAVFRAAGVPAPRTAYAEVTLNVPSLYTDANLGLYTLVENVNTAFLKRVLPPGNGLLLKPEGARVGIPYFGETWAAYQNIYRPERATTPAEEKRVIEFARLVNLAPIPEFRAQIASFLDVEVFLRYIAVNALLVNHDSFLRGSHNYYLYLDPADSRFHFIPWDQDLSLASFARPSPGVELSVLRPWTTDNPLLQKVLDDPVHAARYREILKELATSVFTRAKLLALVDELEAVVATPLAAERAAAARRGDVFAGNARLGHGPAPRDFIEARVAHVAAQLGL